MPNYVTSRQAAEELGIKVQTFWYHMQHGRITPVMRGNGKTGTMFFRPSDVKKLGQKIERLKATKGQR